MRTDPPKLQGYCQSSTTISAYHISTAFKSNILFFLFYFLQVFGFIATIVFALDFYFIFNELATFLKEGGESNDEPTREPGNNCYH